MAPSAKITDFFAKRLSTDDLPSVTKPPAQPASDQQPRSTAMKQSFLDVGQKGLAQKTCTECGMCYDPSFKEDLQRHQRFHVERLGKLDRILFHGSGISPDATINGLSLFILSGDHKQAGEIGERVNIEMEAAPFNLTSKHKLYLLVDVSSEIAGCAITEPIREALEAIPHQDPSLACQLGKQTRPAMIGILRVWVARTRRRQGIAAILLDTVTRKAVFPLKLARKSVAFSQPTTEGFALASSFQRGCFAAASCLVYRCL
jgi:N-acetyltransferase